MKVYLLSKPWLNWPEFARFARDEELPEAQQYMVEPPPDGDLLVELAGRLCYMSYGKGRKTNREFLANILAHQHFSVLEHANWSLLITGVTRSLTHELVRHRHFSFSQLSQRYVDESGAAFIPPHGVDLRELPPETLDLMMAAAQSARLAYAAIAKALEEKAIEIENPTLRRKTARQAARAVLPNCTETKIVVTGNARTWREFIQKRNSEGADPEIRAVAAECLSMLSREAPGLFQDMVA